MKNILNDKKKLNVLCWNAILNMFDTFEHSIIIFVAFLFAEHVY